MDALCVVAQLLHDARLVRVVQVLALRRQPVHRARAGVHSGHGASAGHHRRDVRLRLRVQAVLSQPAAPSVEHIAQLEDGCRYSARSQGPQDVLAA